MEIVGTLLLAQLATLLAHANAARADGGAPGAPLVLCGDMNATPQSAVLQFLRSGRLRYDALDRSTASGQRRVARGAPALAHHRIARPLLPPELGLTHRSTFAGGDGDEGGEGALSKGDGGAEGVLAHPFGALGDAYALLEAQQGGGGVVSTVHLDFAGVVDFVLHSELALRSRGALVLPSAEAVLGAGGLPGRASPSDHLPLLVELDWAEDR